MSRKAIRYIVYVFGAFGSLVLVGAVIGATNEIPVIEVSRETTATREEIWELWADVPGRTRWDEALEYATIEGEFEEGATGVVKLEGDVQRDFSVVSAKPGVGYTDRFALPLNGRMDWQHTITEFENGHMVTFEIRASGPLALVSAPIIRSILKEELPPTVDKLVEVAEGS